MFVEKRTNITLLIIGLYLILNWGFMLIRVPGANIPIGEVLLVVYLLWLYDLRWFENFRQSIFIVPFLLWWGFGLSRALIGFAEHGVWALRDATHAVESLFIWVGFVCAARPGFMDRLFRWIPRLLFIAAIYYFAYPLQEELVKISPRIQALAGYSSPIFFQYANTPTLVLVAAAYLLVFDTRLNAATQLALASFLVAFVVVFSQGRTAYLQVMALSTLIILYKRSAAKKVFWMASAAVLLGVLVLAFDIRLVGRLGQTFSFDFIGKHFLSIFGIMSVGVEGAASGATMRMDWWGAIWRNLTADGVSFVFGLGFGLPLTDFKINNLIIVREPHNSYFSVLARLGAFGLVVFLWMYYCLFSVWRKLYRAYGANKNDLGQNRILILLVYFALILVFAIGEDALEKPFNAIPFYFSWGVILHEYFYVKRLARSVANLPSADQRGSRVVSDVG